MPAGSIVIDLLMKTGSFETDTDRAAKKLREFEKAAVEVGKTAGLALVAAGAAALAFGKQVVDGLDALNDVADATGASIENISALEDVALRTGATLEDVTSILVRFNGALKEADGKNGVSLALKAIGLDVEELKRLDPAEALHATARALAEFEDNANKARIVQELFGKGVAQMAPLLKDLAEKGALVATVTAEQTAEAEKFNKQLSELQKNVTDIARDLVGPVVSAINEVTEAFKRGREAGKGFLEIGWDRYTKNVRDFWGMDQPSEVGATGSWGTPEAPAAQATLPDLDALKKAAEAQKKIEDEARKAAAAAAAEQKRRQTSFNSYLDGLNRQLEKTEDLTVAEQVLKDIQAGRTSASTDAQKQSLLGIAQEIDARNVLKEEEKSRLDSAKALAAAQKQLTDEVKNLYDATRTPLERYIAQQERLNELLDAGRIDADLYTRAMTQAGEALTAATTKGADGLDKMSEASKRAEQNIQDALGDTLEDALSGNFDNIGKAWIALLNKMVSQALAADLLDKLMGRGSGTSNQDALWKGFSTIFSAFSGTTNTGFGTGSAYGNQDYGAFLATGTNYVPYDNFPAILHEGEAVVPKKYNPAAGGRAPGGGFDFSGATYNIGAGVSRGEVEAAVRAGNVQLMGQIQRSERQRYGA